MLCSAFESGRNLLYMIQTLLPRPSRSLCTWSRYAWQDAATGVWQTSLVQQGLGEAMDSVLQLHDDKPYIALCRRPGMYESYLDFADPVA